MVLTNDSMRGGKPNPGTGKDKRLAKNKRSDDGWASDLAAKSGGLPSKSGTVDTTKKV